MQAEEKPYRQRSGIISVTSVLSIGMVLTLLSIVGILFIQSGRLKKIVKEQVQMTIYLNSSAQANQIDSLLRQLKTNNLVRTCKFVSAEDASASLSRELGQDFVQFLGFNPLHANIEVSLQGETANAASMLELKSLVMHFPAVHEVSYPEHLLDDIDVNIRFITTMLSCIALLFLIIALFLINHSVHLQLYAKRFLIKSMQLVGATDGFIRKPFLMQALWQGLAGGVFSMLISALLLSVAPSILPGLENLYDFRLFALLFSGLTIGGIGLNMTSTWLITSHYLKSHISSLY